MTSVPGSASATTPRRAARLTIVIAIAAALAIILAMVHWGGTAQPGPLFAAGVGAMLSILFVFGGLTYWLYASPMPAAQRVKPAQRSAAARQWIAILLMIAGSLFIVGLSWDETWHRQYGVGAVIEDFWWRPHLLMYGAIFTMALFALVGMIVILRGQGTLRQRFRREPQFGLLALACGYLVVSAPVDPLWHQIYGLDITAWSLPHMSMAIGITVVLITALSIQLSVIPRTAWRWLGGLSWREGVAIAFLMMAQLILFQFFAVEWDGLRTVGFGAPQGFWDRPEWLYPVLLTSVAAFTGFIGVFSLRRAGVATLSGLGALLIRTLTLTVLGSSQFGMTANAQWLSLAPLIAIDIVVGLRLKRADSASTFLLAALAAAAAAIVIDLPVISQIMVYPRINADTAPAMIIGMIVFTLGFGWAGWRLGTALSVFGRATVPQESTVRGGRAALIGALAFGAALLFMILFIGTASPPVV